MLPQKKLFYAINALLSAVAIGTISSELFPRPVGSKEDINIFPKIADTPFYRVVFVSGAIAGALIAGLTRDMIRSQLNIAIFDVSLAIGLAMYTVPHKDTTTSVACRLSLSVGVGGLSAIVPSYVGEISNPKSRGKLNMFFQIAVVVGIMLSCIFGPFVEYCPQKPLKALFNVSCCLWAMIHAVVSCLIPVPQSHLFFEENVGDENMSLTDDSIILDEGYANIHEYLIEMLAQINEINTNRQLNPVSYLPNVLSIRSHRKSLFIGIGVMFFHQICGVNILIAYYMDHIILQNSIIEISLQTAFITVGVLQIVVILVSMTVIDQVGRHTLLKISAMLMSISSVGLFGCFCVTQLKIDTGNIMNMLTLIFVGICISAYSLGFGPVPWVIVGEIFSLEVKSYGICFATATNWTMVIAVSYMPLNGVICSNMGIGIFLIVYFVASLFGVIFVRCFVPQMKNGSLFKIQQELTESDNLAAYSIFP